MLPRAPAQSDADLPPLSAVLDVNNSRRARHCGQGSQAAAGGAAAERTAFAAQLVEAPTQGPADGGRSSTDPDSCVRADSMRGQIG
eukprot:5092004-Pleurochrysis_carterae.AAC.1